MVGTPPGVDARNNVPELWDNHGTKYSNVLYADGHAVSPASDYWEEWLSEHLRKRVAGSLGLEKPFLCWRRRSGIRSSPVPIAVRNTNGRGVDNA